MVSTAIQGISADRPSILLGQHDRHYACSLSSVGRIFRAVLKRQVVIVDFPEELLLTDGHAAKIMLPIGVIVGRKRVEVLHGGNGRSGEIHSKCESTGSETALATSQRLAECIVEFADLVRVSGRHNASFRQ